MYAQAQKAYSVFNEFLLLKVTLCEWLIKRTKTGPKKWLPFRSFPLFLLPTVLLIWVSGYYLVCGARRVRQVLLPVPWLDEHRKHPFIINSPLIKSSMMWTYVCMPVAFLRFIRWLKVYQQRAIHFMLFILMFWLLYKQVNNLLICSVLLHDYPTFLFRSVCHVVGETFQLIQSQQLLNILQLQDGI